MGHKFIASAHCLDAQFPRAEAIQELAEVVKAYEESKAAYQRLWLAEDRDNSQYHTMISWYDRTLAPCRQKLEELEKNGKTQSP
jgi:hypothetical protein